MDTSRVIDNLTPMAARCVPLSDRHGREVLVVVAKMTWEVSPSGHVRVAAAPSPIRFGAEPWPEPFRSERYPSDLCTEKPGTDVLLLGTAYPPGLEQGPQRGGPSSAQGLSELEVGLRIAAGDRFL